MVDDPMTDDLRAVLKNAAGYAPPPDNELLARVETRYRGRRRRRMAGTAATVAVVVGATGVLGAALRPGGDDAPRPASKPTAGPLKPATPGPVVELEKTAPQAFRKLPAKLPNGRGFHPVQMLDDRTVLGTTWSSFELTDRIWTYDLTTGRARLVTTLTIPRGPKWYANSITAGDGQVAWTMNRSNGGAEFEPTFDRIELWTAPLAGGAPRKVTSIAVAQSPLQGDTTSAELAVSGGEANWATPAGVLTVPLTGGTPRLLPGTKGYQILSWPWIGTPGRGRTGPKLGEVLYKDLRNVRTGERRTATTAKVKGAWSCGLVWCLGGPASGVTYQGTPGLMVQRRDGKEGRTLPAGRGVGPLPGVTFLDRYILYRPSRDRSRNHLLYDLRTGRLLDTGMRDPGSGPVPGLLASPGSGILSLPGEDGARTLLDLSKVG
ncbi:hypothetical protein ACFVH6_44465 [Spirillospora sp. NPDC127200]